MTVGFPVYLQYVVLNRAGGYAQTLPDKSQIRSFDQIKKNLGFPVRQVVLFGKGNQGFVAFPHQGFLRIFPEQSSASQCEFALTNPDDVPFSNQVPSATIGSVDSNSVLALQISDVQTISFHCDTGMFPRYGARADDQVVAFQTSDHEDHLLEMNYPGGVVLQQSFQEPTVFFGLDVHMPIIPNGTLFPTEESVIFGNRFNIARSKK